LSTKTKKVLYIIIPHHGNAAATALLLHPAASKEVEIVFL